MQGSGPQALSLVLIPALRSPLYPQAHSPSPPARCAGSAWKLSPGKLSLAPLGHCPHPRSFEPLLPRMPAEVALISGTHQPPTAAPAEQAAPATAARWTLGAAWWGVQTKVLGALRPG